MAKARTLLYLQGQVPDHENAVLIIQTRLAEFYAWEDYIYQPDRSEELHNLRIAAKRLRYTLETFSDALPAAATALIEELTLLQDELGQIHDSDVRAALLHICLHEVADIEGPQDSSSHDPSTGSLATLQDRFDFPAPLLANLLDPTHIPNKGEQQGLALLLQDVHNERKEHYATFRQHWDQMTRQDFRGRILALLDYHDAVADRS